MKHAIPLGKRLRAKRLARGLTLAEVGKDVGVTGECIRRWEEGLHVPKRPMAEAWRRAVLTTEELLR